MEGDLRVIGAGLDAEVAAGVGRLQLVAREVRQVGEFGRAQVLHFQLAEEAGADAKGEGEVVRVEAVCFAGVGRRDVEVFAVGFDVFAAGEVQAVGRPHLEHFLDFFAVIAVQVGDEEVDMFLCRGSDARLVAAVEGDFVMRGRVGGGRRAGCAFCFRSSAGDKTGTDDSTLFDKTPTRWCICHFMALWLVGYSMMTPICASGSPSLFTASASALISSLLRVS